MQIFPLVSLTDVGGFHGSCEPILDHRKSNGWLPVTLPGWWHTTWKHIDVCHRREIVEGDASRDLRASSPR